MTDPVAEARARGLEQRAVLEAFDAPAPPPPPALEEEPEPEAEAPRFADGDAVVSTDPRLPSGVITGEGEACTCFTVTPHDGSEPYQAPESTLSEEEPMTDETTAPEALAASLGLQAGATLGQCTAAAADLKAIADKAQAEAEEANTAARLQAFKAAGLRDDPKALEVATSTLSRAEGQSWTDAVAAHKGDYPFLYAAAEPAPAPVVEEAPEARPEPAAPAASKPAPVFPAGVTLGGGAPPAAALPKAHTAPTLAGATFIS